MNWARIRKINAIRSAAKARAEAYAATLPPKPRNWSVSEIRRLALETTQCQSQSAGAYLGDGKGYEWTDATLISVYAVIDGDRILLAGPDRILNRQGGLDGCLEQYGLAGRYFTQRAWAELESRVNTLVASA